MPEPHIFDTSAIPWTEEARFPGIAFKLLETRATHPAVSLVLARVDVGKAIQTHTHPIETETAIVWAGQGVIKIGDQELPLSVGVGITIPPGLAHSVHNTGDVPLELFAFHSPPTR